MTEQIAHIPTIEPAELTIQEELRQALVKANVTDERIAELYAKAAEFDKEITNAVEYAAAEKARLDIRKVRLLGEKSIERIDRRFLDLRQESLRVKKELLEKINGPELLLIGRTSVWEKEQERLKKEQEDAVAAMREQRKTEVQALGFQFVPGPPAHRYVLEEVEITMMEIMEADHTTWNERFGQLRLKSEEVAERKAKAEEEALDRQLELQVKEEQQRLKQQELDEKQRSMNDQMLKIMRKELTSLGLEFNGVAWHYRGFTFTRIVEPLYDMEEEAWDAILQEVVAHIEKANEGAERAKLNQARKAEMLALGLTIGTGERGEALTIDDAVSHYVNELHDFNDEDWAAELEFQEGLVKSHKELAVAMEAARELYVMRVATLKQAGYTEKNRNFGNGFEAALWIDTPEGEHSMPLTWINDEDEHVELFSELVGLGHAELERRKKEQEAVTTFVALPPGSAIVVPPEQLNPVLIVEQEVLTDTDLWNAWMLHIKDNKPTLKSAIGNNAVGTVLKYLDKLTPGVLRDIK